MKKYIVLITLLVLTVALTLGLSNLYKIYTKKTTPLYNYLNTINIDEFEDYITESGDTFIYIADKYDFSYTKFENDFKRKIESKNLKNKVVYLQLESIDKSFIKLLKEKYKIKISLEKAPILMVINDKKINDLIYIEDDMDSSIIDYGLLK